MSTFLDWLLRRKPVQTPTIDSAAHSATLNLQRFGRVVRNYPAKEIVIDHAVDARLEHLKEEIRLGNVRPEALDHYSPVAIESERQFCSFLFGWRVSEKQNSLEDAAKEAKINIVKSRIKRGIMAKEALAEIESSGCLSLDDFIVLLRKYAIVRTVEMDLNAIEQRVGACLTVPNDSETMDVYGNTGRYVVEDVTHVPITELRAGRALDWAVCQAVGREYRIGFGPSRLMGQVKIVWPKYVVIHHFEDVTTANNGIYLVEGKTIPEAVCLLIVKTWKGTSNATVAIPSELLK